MKKILLLLLVFTLHVTRDTLHVVYAESAAVTVKSRVDRSKITVGDRIVYTVIVEKPAGAELAAFNPSPASEIFEVKDLRQEKPRKRGGKEITEFRYTITVFSVGSYAIPSLLVAYKDLAGNTSTASTDTIPILVESVLKGETAGADIRDIKPPLSIKSYLLFYVLAIAAGLVISWILWKRRKGEPVFPAQKPLARPAHEIAIERLKKLEEMDLVLRGKIKKYYIVLSEIMRLYIEERYSVFATERTTTELYQEMRVKGIERRHCGMLKELLDQSDLVKFARFIPEKTEIDRDLAMAYEIVDLTKEIVPVEPAP